ncbi:hypothetical protein V1527DRAFT_486221 [Lipomyces starkeyi]
MIEKSDFEDAGAYEDSEYFDLVAIELAKIMPIVGDVCHFVYGTQSISSSASQELAMKLRQWNSELPRHMQLVKLPSRPSTQGNELRRSQDETQNKTNSLRASASSVLDGHQQQKTSIDKKTIMRQALLRIHLCHLNGIILLTRPFFFFSVVGNIKDREESSDINKAVMRLSSACVLCAARSVDLVMALLMENEQPSRPPFLIYFIFSAGLILVFEAFNQKANLESYIVRGISLCMFILDYYAVCDPSSLRYRNILEEMDLAVRAACTTDPERGNHLGQMDQINKDLSNLLNPSRSGSPLSRTANEFNHAERTANSPAGSRREEEDLLFRELRCGDFSGAAGAQTHSSNISAMFLRAAANGGRYHVSNPGLTMPPDKHEDNNCMNTDTSNQNRCSR